MNAYSESDKLCQSSADLEEAIQTYDVPEIENVDAEQLLSVFFEGIAKDRKLSGTQVRALVEGDVQEVVKDDDIREALRTYRESGNMRRDEDPCPHFIALCNKVLEKVRVGSLKAHLDLALQGEDAKPIRFIYSASLYLARDWEYKEPRTRRPHDLRPTKPDIIVVHEDLELIRKCKEYEERTNFRTFDPCETPASKQLELDFLSTYKVRLSDILCWGEVKWPNRGPKQTTKAMHTIGEESFSGSAQSRGCSDEGGPPRKMRRVSKSSPGLTSSERSTAHQSQLAHYASEMLSRGPYATHTLGMTLDYNQIQFLWFDRQNVIGTQKFNPFDDFGLLVTFLIALSRFSLHDWGIEERFYPRGDQIETKIGGTHTVRINITHKPLCHRVTLLGRGTLVLRGDLIVDGVATTPVAIKVSYPEGGRVAEPEFIRLGREHSAEFQEYLPLVHASEDPPYTTGRIRQQLKLGERGQARQCRIIIFELLESITTLSNSTEFASVWRDCVVVHRIMWKKKLEHGDIGLGNLMYRRKGKNVLGVLIDWDLATKRGEEADEVFGGGTHRTGTIPFVSLQLIDSKPPRRKYRHDAESMGWTLRFGCLDRNNPDNLPLIEGWLDANLTARTRSGSLLLGSKAYKLRPGFEELFQISEVLLTRLLPSPAVPSRFSPGSSSTRNESDLIRSIVKTKWSTPQQVKWTELDDEEAWEIAKQTLEMIFDK